MEVFFSSVPMQLPLLKDRDSIIFVCKKCINKNFAGFVITSRVKTKVAFPESTQ